VKTNGGKVDGETSIKLHPSLDSFDQLRDVGMTLTYQLPWPKRDGRTLTGLKLLYVLTIPMIGRDSASSL
jgi:hypothetical protein